MIKKTITFTNFDGEDITEDWYFGLNAGEIAEMELTSNGTLSDRLLAVGKSIEGDTNAEKVARASGGEIMQLFKELIMASVGKRSEDGRRFVKNQEVTDDFIQTGCYSNLLMELVSEPEKAAEFVNGIMPADIVNQAKAAMTTTDVPLPDSDVPAWIREDREPTQAELNSMSQEQLREAFARREMRQRQEAKSVTGIQ